MIQKERSWRADICGLLSNKLLRKSQNLWVSEMMQQLWRSITPTTTQSRVSSSSLLRTVSRCVWVPPKMETTTSQHSLCQCLTILTQKPAPLPDSIALLAEHTSHRCRDQCLWLQQKNPNITAASFCTSTLFLTSLGLWCSKDTECFLSVLKYSSFSSSFCHMHTHKILPQAKITPNKWFVV